MKNKILIAMLFALTLTACGNTKNETKVEEKPFNTEYVYDENLEAGQTEEVTPG